MRMISTPSIASISEITLESLHFHFHYNHFMASPLLLFTYAIPILSWLPSFSAHFSAHSPQCYQHHLSKISIQVTSIPCFKTSNGGFFCGPIVKNSPCKAEGTDLIPGPGRSNMPQSNKVPIPQVQSQHSRATSHNYWVHVLQLLKLTYLEPVFHNKRSYCDEKPTQQMKSSTCSLQLEKAVWSSKDSPQPEHKINKSSKKEKSKPPVGSWFCLWDSFNSGRSEMALLENSLCKGMLAPNSIVCLNM